MSFSGSLFISEAMPALEPCKWRPHNDNVQYIKTYQYYPLLSLLFQKKLASSKICLLAASP